MGAAAEETPRTIGQCSGRQIQPKAQQDNRQDGGESIQEVHGPSVGTPQMKRCAGILCWLVLTGAVLVSAQSDSKKPAASATSSGGSSATPPGSSAAELERSFFAIVKSGDA